MYPPYLHMVNGYRYSNLQLEFLGACAIKHCIEHVIHSLRSRGVVNYITHSATHSNLIDLIHDFQISYVQKYKRTLGNDMHDKKYSKVYICYLPVYKKGSCVCIYSTACSFNQFPIVTQLNPSTDPNNCKLLKSGLVLKKSHACFSKDRSFS